MATPVHSTVELEAMLARVAREPNIGLIFSSSNLNAKLIVETVARYRLPAIYGTVDEAFMTEGGLMYYFSDPSEPFRLLFRQHPSPSEEHERRRHAARASPFNASPQTRSVSCSTNDSSIFSLNGGCTN